MQSEGVEEVSTSTETDRAVADMTYKETDFGTKAHDDSKYLKTSVNLDDDIEKIEVSTPESSESNGDIQKRPFFPGLPDQNPNETIKHWLERITDFQRKFNSPCNDYSTIKQQSQPAPNRVVKYQDLPYMGEMTLENSKPRRGRKPKKADICHLIYKNYGTIFPGTPNPKSYTDKDKKPETESVQRSDVQNRIISSLLERRLTQEIRKTKDVPESTNDQNEPLNLCIKDLNHLKIRLQKVKSEPQSDEDTPSSPKSEPTPEDLSSPDPSRTPDPGFAYWPNAGVFLHPMALQQQLMYYQRMATGGVPNHSPRPPPEESPRKSIKEESEGQKAKRNASNASDRTPTKRKRSAIFIPPIPTENNTNPATEVSICKFKFTGGAKPSLQEKKMLSVDSGGNFRYYSGTGDKSMRGYEFFPRETLQQQINNTQGSSTGAFLQASGEKIYPVGAVDFTGGRANGDFLLTPEAVTPPVVDARQKKRKSRKSLQREKLEQTFKEKGFLIQTQQLESAEGATYCKFRQLRKFTRYLFRSWKDYLPGNVRELQECEKIDTDEYDDSLSRHSSEVSTNHQQS